MFILPPSVGELERRLRGRKTDSEAVIQRRLKDALGDMTHWTEFDHVIVNEDFATALEQLAAVIAGREQDARTELADRPRRGRSHRERPPLTDEACPGRGVLH